MATASKPLGGNAKYVFKMQYDAGGSAPMHRRYGYVGELALPQVYEGLHERASQTFGIARENVVIRVRDNLGNPHLHLDSYQAFLRHVYMPLQQRPHEAKIDDKKRIVLAFVVTDKDKVKRRLAELEAEAKTLRAKMDEIERQRAKAAEAKAKKDKLERQAALAKEQAKVRAQHASARPAAAAAVAAATAAKTSRMASPVQHADPVSKPKAVSKPKVVESSRGEPARAVESAPSKSTLAAAPAKLAPMLPPPQADKATAWTGVQGLLEAFVENLNAHLADTFGDSAVPLDFKQLAEKKLGSASSQAADANKAASKSTPPKEAGTRAAKPVYHPSVFCDGCNEDLFGPRYKCLNCSNYDLCGACMDQRHSHHAASHAFAEIRFPGDKHHETTRGSTTAGKNSPPARHAATCNLCDKTICGARYKCLECPDFDLDSACYDTNVRELHPGHKFVRLQSPRDYVVPSCAPPVAPRHRHVRCDGCQREPIVGVRYRCMHPSCADYDLCADCEALPIPVHPHDHPLLKIRQPLDPWTDRAKVTVARDRARTLVARREVVLLGPGSADGGAGDGASAPVVDGSSAPVVDASSSPVDDGPGSDTTADTVLDKLVAAADTTADTVLDKLVAAAVSVQEVETGAKTPEAEAEENTREVTPEEAVEEDSPAVEEQELSATETTAPAPTDSVSQQPDHSSPPSLPHATFVSDITLLDGIAVPAGAEFQKVWAVRAGPAGWPAGCRLVHVGGFSSKHFASTTTASSSFDVAAAAPNEVVSISCDCKAPEDSGRFIDFWRLALPDGTLFGERLWIDLTIESEPVASLSSSSSSVLFMAPSLDAQGQAAAPSSTFASNLSEFESVVRSVGADSRASSSVSDSISDPEEDFVFLSGDSEGSEL